MHTRHRPALAATLATLVIGCYPKFTILPKQDLPPALATRAQLKNYSTYQDHLEELVGHVVFIKKQSGACPQPSERIFDAIDVSRKVYLTGTEALKQQTLSRLMYEAKMDRSTAHGAKFGFGSVDFGAAQAVEFIVTDTMELTVGTRLDNQALDALAATPVPQDACARLVIKGAILSVVHYRVYTKLETKYDITGSAFGVGGNVYHATSQFQTQFILGLEVGELRDERQPSAPRFLVRHRASAAGAPESDFQPVILVVPAGGFPKRD